MLEQLYAAAAPLHMLTSHPLYTGICNVMAHTTASMSHTTASMPTLTIMGDLQLKICRLGLQKSLSCPSSKFFEAKEGTEPKADPLTPEAWHNTPQASCTLRLICMSSLRSAVPGKQM